MGAAQPEETSGEVPEKPLIAPGVQLSGAMQDAGFERSQYLVQRGGHFMQLTGLLYRILQQADGKHTLAQIAQAVSQATGTQISAADVGKLVAEHLVPGGLVRAADGQVEGQEEENGVRSPLKINLRTKVIGPEIINPITRLLLPLYTPPVLIVALLIAFAAQGWVLFVHGLARGIHQMLYDPALMLVMLLILIVETAFHELGHATALRYGGGKVRGMGVGFYLVYPAFYTDVTENYLLPRGARVRTDLGGFYFNLLFALAITGFYFLTRQEFLLVGVMIADLEIVQQITPFTRLDGYWALADATGIPDFYSDLLPFIRSVVPIPGWKGPRLPNLKGWVKAVFALYILIGIPAMLLILFLLIKNVPRVIITALDSAGKQAHLLAQAQTHGNGLGMLLAGVQLLVLALPAFGSIYLLFNLGRSVFGAIWQWSQPSVPRRLAGSAASAAIVAFLAYLWIPQIPFGSNAPLRSATTFRPISYRETGTVSGAVSDLIHPAPIRPPRGSGRIPPRRGVVTKPAGHPRRRTPTTATATPRASETPTVTAAGSGIRTPPPTGRRTPTVTSASTGVRTATPTATPSSFSATPTTAPLVPPATPGPRQNATPLATARAVATLPPAPTTTPLP